MSSRPQRRQRASAGLDSKQKLRLWLRLLQAARRIQSELRERLRASFGTTLPRFDIMAALARHNSGMSMTELSRSLMVSNGNVTGIVDRLAAEGMVVRLPDANDRRATLVRLTRNGAKKFQAMAAAHEAWVGETLSSISDEDADVMIELLNAIGRRVPAEGPRA